MIPTSRLVLSVPSPSVHSFIFTTSDTVMTLSLRETTPRISDSRVTILCRGHNRGVKTPILLTFLLKVFSTVHVEH